MNQKGLISVCVCVFLCLRARVCLCRCGFCLHAGRECQPAVWLPRVKFQLILSQSKLNHTNVITVFHFGRSSGKYAWKKRRSAAVFCAHSRSQWLCSTCERILEPMWFAAFFLRRVFPSGTAVITYTMRLLPLCAAVTLACIMFGNSYTGKKKCLQRG